MLDYKFQFAGVSGVLQIDGAVENALIQHYRYQAAVQRWCRRHITSYDAVSSYGECFESFVCVDTKDPEDIVIARQTEQEGMDRLHKALATLTEVQRRRLLLYANQMSTRDVAEHEGCTPSCAWESIAAAQKKIHEYYDALDRE